jgi:hypothetical protein
LEFLQDQDIKGLHEKQKLVKRKTKRKKIMELDMCFMYLVKNGEYILIKIVKYVNSSALVAVAKIKIFRP